ncbi:MAG: hypothetical protein RL701_7804, partial [Pseudomonadota bacterium]
MFALDRLIPAPRLFEIDDVEIALPVAQVWQAIRHGDLACTPLIRALFALRALPERLSGAEPSAVSLRIDELKSTPEHPGFQLLVETEQELAVAAIGKVWRPKIPYVHVSDAAAYAAFDEPGFIKVAWALQLQSSRAGVTRLSVELRVDATDETAWGAFQRYFTVIGPASRFIRHAALHAIARGLLKEHRAEPRLDLPGDGLLSDAAAEITQDIVIKAPPHAIWPWLVQMGCDRAGFYSIDILDNAGIRSAREIHPEWQQIAVGQRICASPKGDAQFEVLQVEAPHALVLGCLIDTSSQRMAAFFSERPARYWQVTWAFVLRSETPELTRLHVRARAAFTGDAALHAAWIRPLHYFMEREQLLNLRARAEGLLDRDDARDVIEGVGGAFRIAFELIAPFRRGRHTYWGLDKSAAETKQYPGDHLVPEPDWSWTHAIDVAGSAAQVWPWLSQVGAKHAGFYSYQWLENLAGCEIRNAETIHPEWEVTQGGDFFVHPHAPPLKVTDVARGHWFVAHAATDPAERQRDQRWVSVSWLFYIEE